MAKKEYAFYPSCSSQLGGSASNYLTSVDSMCKTLDIKLTQIPDMVEVLIEDFGYDQLKKPVVKPLEGLKFAGYVGCQTNRPFGINGESFENPVYLDKLVETVGGEAVTAYDQKVTCCGGALAFSEPDKSQKQIKDIVESARPRRGDDRHALSAVPGQRRDLPERNQQEIRHQVQHAGHVTASS